MSFNACSPKTESVEDSLPPQPLETFISPSPLDKAANVDDIQVGAVIKDEDNNSNSGSVLFGFDHNVWRLLLSQTTLSFYAGKQKFGGDIQFTVNRSDTAKIKEIFSKFLNWNETAIKENVHSFKKEIATIGKSTYEFSYEAGNKPYDRSQIHVTEGSIIPKCRVLVADVEKYKVLLRQIPILEKKLKQTVEEFKGLKQKQNKEGSLFK